MPDLARQVIARAGWAGHAAQALGRARGHGNDMTCVPGDWSATKAAGAQERGMEGVA